MATFFSFKDPNAILDYAIDWTDWLATTTDTIGTSSWIVPTALSTTSAAISGTATTIVWLAGGTAGEVYNVINRIVTSGGRTEDRTIQFTCVDR